MKQQQLVTVMLSLGTFADGENTLVGLYTDVLKVPLEGNQKIQALRSDLCFSECDLILYLHYGE